MKLGRRPSAGGQCFTLLAWAVVSFSLVVHADEPADAPPAKQGAELTKRIRVLNQKGEPVVGATVIPWAVRSKQGHGAWRVADAYDAEPPKMITDAEGRGSFAFPEFLDKDGRIPPMEYTCSVTHPDYATTMYNDVPVADGAFKEESVIDVRPGALIEITAFAEGRDIALDHVHVLWSSPMRENGRDKINEQGAIVLPRLPAGNELLQVAYVPDEGAVLFSDLKKLDLADGDHHQLRLELQPAVRVEGRLDGPVARPVREGRVIGEVIQWDENVQHPLTWRAAAKMRIDGSFVFEAMPRGDLQVIALCTGAMAADGEPPAFARDHEKQQGASFFCRPQVFKLAEETTRIVVKMTPTADCLVHVVGPDGVAVEGADCAFWPNVGWWRDGSQIYCAPFYDTIEFLRDPKIVTRVQNDRKLFWAKTDAEGEALIPNLPPKAGQMAIIHDALEIPGDDPHRSHPVSLVAGQQVEVTVKLQPKKLAVPK